eukprot:13649786-Alexandrium_andersonii.AAC.1
MEHVWKWWGLNMGRYRGMVLRVQKTILAVFVQLVRGRAMKRAIQGSVQADVEVWRAGRGLSYEHLPRQSMLG